MRRLAPALLVSALLVAGASPAAAGPKRPAADPAVAPWIELTLETIAAQRTNPPRAARGLALVSVAMAEAAEQARHRRQAAVAGAASVVLAYLYPGEAGRFDALSRIHGSASGRRIGRRLVERGRQDGSDAVWSGASPEGRGSGLPRRRHSRRRSSRWRARGGPGTCARDPSCARRHLRDREARSTRPSSTRSTPSPAR